MLCLPGRKARPRPPSLTHALIGYSLVGLMAGGAWAQPPLERAREAISAMDYQAARGWIDRAIEEAEKRGDPKAKAEALLELTVAIRLSGGADRALEPVAEAISLLEAEGPSPLLADALRLRAEALQARGLSAGVEEDLEAAASFYEQSGDATGLARVDSTSAVLASRRGDYHRALERGQKALDNADEPAALRALSSVAYSQHHLGHWQDARASYDRLIDLAWQANDQRVLSFAYCNRAEVSWELGDERPAVDDLRQAVERFEEGRGRTAGSAEERAAYLEREIAGYDRLVRYLVDQGQVEEAFGVAERLHGRSLLDRLNSSGQTGAAEKQRRRQIVGQIGRARLELEDAVGARQGALKGELAKLERSLRDLHAQGPRRASAKAPELAAVQAKLGSDEALLSFWSAEQRLIVWVVSRDQMRLIQVPVARSDLHRVLDRFAAPLRSSSRAADQALLGTEVEHLEAGRQLYKWLIAPLGEPARSASRWVIVPDGRLHELPFGALVERCTDAGEASSVHALYATCEYVGQRRSISYSPSAGVLLALRDRRERSDSDPAELAGGGAGGAKGNPRKSLLALAPSFDGDMEVASVRANRGPLRYSAEEVRRIGRFFDDARLLLGDQANESTLAEDLSSYRRLHFATHGLVDDELPLGAGLLLEKAADQDGLLLIPEVLDLDLDADLVTLSACRTGRGRPSRAEGMVGLTRAFLAAGASALVVSLWDVDDRSTAMLMDAFYRRLAEGQRPSDALRAARSWMIEQQGETRLVFKKQALSYAHPRYWAGFVVVGAD